MTARAFLSIGCNIGDCRGQLETALARLQDDESTTLARISSVYITEPVGNKDQPDFFNIAVEIETGLEPLALLRFCRDIEERLGGRVGREDKGPRTIDLDILLYEQVEMSTAELVLPHPRMTERGFVLVPLAEIVPELRLPEGNTVADALAQLTDPHQVEKSGKLNGFSGGKLG
jgi:2-amino-4-hydroxy-6-hydroxymethyldihydropteridine diphosphokinase